MLEKLVKLISGKSSDSNMSIGIVVTRAGGKKEDKGIVAKGNSKWKASAN